jgi:hypothetical protein
MITLRSITPVVMPAAFTMIAARYPCAPRLHSRGCDGSFLRSSADMVTTRTPSAPPYRRHESCSRPAFVSHTIH